jgi:hypothetical protein
MMNNDRMHRLVGLQATMGPMLATAPEAPRLPTARDLLTEQRLSIPQAAEILGVSEVTVWRYLAGRAGSRGVVLRSHYLGRRRYILFSDLQRFLEESQPGNVGACAAGERPACAPAADGSP